MNDEYFMKEALALARAAAAEGETPIGCVVVVGGEIISRGRNMRNTLKNPLKHAEIVAIDEAAQAAGDWRLEDATLYVTIEPCPMCAGAIIQARIKRLVYGAANKKAGSAGSVCDLFSFGYNHIVEVTSGVLAKEAGELLSAFFKELRGNLRKPTVRICHFSKKRLKPRIFLRNWHSSRGFRRLPMECKDIL